MQFDERAITALVCVWAIGSFGIFSLSQGSIGEKFFLSGGWMLMSFFGIVLFDGARHNKSKQDVLVPKRPAIIVIGLALVFFALGAHLGVGE